MGNDFLLMALVAHRPSYVVVYVLCATIGSVLGIALTVWLSGKGADKLKKNLKRKRFKKVEEFVHTHAAWALGLASIMPPPFPFTWFVAAAGIVKYPHRKILAVVSIGRLVRFCIEAALAIHYGRWIISFAKSPAIREFAIVMVVLAVLGSAYSLYSWMRR